MPIARSLSIIFCQKYFAIKKNSITFVQNLDFGF